MDDLSKGAFAGAATASSMLASPVPPRAETAIPAAARPMEVLGGLTACLKLDLNALSFRANRWAPSKAVVIGSFANVADALGKSMEILKKKLLGLLPCLNASQNTWTIAWVSKAEQSKTAVFK